MRLLKTLEIAQLHRTEHQPPPRAATGRGAPTAPRSWQLCGARSCPAPRRGVAKLGAPMRRSIKPAAMVWRRLATAILLAVLLAGAEAADSTPGQPIVTPTEINTCSNSSSDTAPQISRLQTCARAAVSGYGMGSAFSFASSQGSVLRVASAACGDAVAGSIGDLCAGADPMATIFSMARTCATAMAALYTKSVTSNAVFDMSPRAVEGNVTKEGKLQACGSGCANAQGSAEAFAQAAACGVAVATDNCIAATTHVKTRAFSRSFIKSTADSWSKACTEGTGLANSGGETIAVTAAASIARAMAQVAAQACANCPTCKCRKLPVSFNWNDAGDFSDAAATITAGRVGLARAVADATTNFCASDGSMQSAKVHASALMNTLADLVVAALGAVRGYATAVGQASWACGSGSLVSDLTAIKDVSSEVFADAAGVVFDSWCPKASAKLSQMELLTSETLNQIVNKVAQRCTQRDGNGQSGDIINTIVTGSKPFVENIAEALTEAKSCGCKSSKCFWCSAGQELAAAPKPAPAPSKTPANATAALKPLKPLVPTKSTK